MNTLIKIATLLICLNITFYCAVNLIMFPDGEGEYKSMEYEIGVFQFKGDLIDVIFGENFDETIRNNQEGFTSYPDLEDGFISAPSQAGGETLGTNVISFLDSLRIVWAIIPTLFNIAITPVALLFANNLNPMFGLMIGVPFVIIYILAIFMFIRGVGD